MPKIEKDVHEAFDRASARFKKAFYNLPEDKQAIVKELIKKDHGRAVANLKQLETLRADVTDVTIPELALADAALRGLSLEEVVGEDGEDEDEELVQRALAFRPRISPGGQIWWFRKYQQLDPGWLESAAVWLENFENKVEPFPSDPVTHEIPDDTTLALVGDWGAGDYGRKTPASLQVADVVRKLNPDYAIHLGDVYYAGTPEEQRDNFLRFWAPGSRGSFALNSNHEMMDGGHGYFETLLTDEMFKDQNGTSYFALENSNWVILGLDSSYFADYWKMYGPGNLDSVFLLPFLKKHAEAAHAAGKKLLVMTHQNGLESDGSATTELWNQVQNQLPAGSQAYWYWGHEHLGVVYGQQSNILPRCTGYGAIPWGFASALENPNVSWFEKEQNPDVSYQVMNGLTLLTLSGPKITEQFIDQIGAVRWTSP